MIARRVGSLLIVLAAGLLAPAVAEPATNGRIVFSSSRDTDFASERYSIAPTGRRHAPNPAVSLADATHRASVRFA